MGAEFQHSGHHHAVQAGPHRGDLLDGQAELAELVADLAGVAGHGGELLQPGQQDLHRSPPPWGAKARTGDIRTATGNGGRCGTVREGRQFRGA